MRFDPQNGVYQAMADPNFRGPSQPRYDNTDIVVLCACSRALLANLNPSEIGSLLFSNALAFSHARSRP